jgi:hypothetical protein
VLGFEGANEQLKGEEGCQNQPEGELPPGAGFAGQADAPAILRELYI